VLAALGHAPVAKSPPSGIVALGDPDFGCAQVGRSAAGGAPPGAPAAGTLPRLPNTAAEIVALTSLAGARPVKVLTGAHATRDTLLDLAELPHAELLHIATHGIASESDPSRSGLWMAASDSTAWPGFLSIGDIRTLKLGASLVTLSACETGLGRLERGEGVVGLMRAFLGAGAGSVVVSLWSVNDVSTAMLMNSFYRELLANGATRDVALARAKRALLARPETRAPFHWAPFVLVGESGALR
jgi:CHAT domain-containing protein